MGTWTCLEKVGNRHDGKIWYVYVIRCMVRTCLLMIIAFGGNACKPRDSPSACAIWAPVRPSTHLKPLRYNRSKVDDENKKLCVKSYALVGLRVVPLCLKEGFCSLHTWEYMNHLFKPHLMSQTIAMGRVAPETLIPVVGILTIQKMRSYGLSN